MLTLIIGIASGLLAGAVAALAIIAPLTKSAVDDKALEIATKALEIVAKAKALTTPLTK